MVSVPAYFVQRMRAVHGNAGVRWALELPETLRGLEDCWSVSVADPFEGLTYNYVAPVVCADGQAAVIKLGMPSSEGDRESFALEEYAGQGAVRLIARDERHCVMLLERIMPGDTLLDLPDDEAVATAAESMKRLWRPATKSFPNLDVWTKSLQKYEVHSGPLLKSDVNRAMGLRAELLNNPPDQVLLHGDLHHTNVLRSDQRGWLAIDPKGIVGEQSFEVVQFLMNPGPMPAEQTARRISIFTDRLDLDPQRVLAWAFVQAMVSACWSVEDGEGWEGAVSFGEVALSMMPSA